MTLRADVGNGHDFPKCSARQRSNREDPGGGLPRYIDESAVARGIQANAHWINPGKPIVEQAAEDRIGRVMRYRIDTRAFHDTGCLHRLCSRAPPWPERNEGRAFAAFNGLNFS